MNQKAISPTKSGRRVEKVGSNPKIRVQDILYSDSDTVTEFSNREISNSREDDKGNLVVVRIFDETTSESKLAETLGNDLRTLRRHFKVFCAPHQSTLQFANYCARKAQDRPFLYVTPKIAEPNVKSEGNKFRFMIQSEIQKMKCGAIFSKTSWSSKPTEVVDDVVKRVEARCDEIVRQCSDVVFVCGPTVADIIVNCIIKNAKIRAPTQQNVKIQIDHYSRKKTEWDRVSK